MYLHPTLSHNRISAAEMLLWDVLLLAIAICHQAVGWSLQTSTMDQISQLIFTEPLPASSYFN